MKKQIIASVLSLVAAISAYAQQSGWLVPKGETKVSAYYGRYNANSYKDANGNTTDYGNGVKFSSDYFKASAEYGLTNDLNLYVSIPLVNNVQTNPAGNQRKMALGDSELGVSANLKKWERTYLVASVVAGIPLYSKKSTPAIGLGQYSTQASLKYCGSIGANYKFFFAVEQSARLYFDKTMWWNNSAQLGYNISKKHSLLSETSGAKSFGKGTFNPLPDANRAAFFYQKVALGYYYTATTKIQFGGTLWHDIINRNSSIGRGVSAIAIVKL